MMRTLLVWSLVVLLTGCSSSLPSPHPILGGQPSPGQILAGGRRPVPRALLTWGGTVQAVYNRRDATLVEVLSYPLDRSQHPIVGAESTGRFAVEMKGFIEPAELPIGRPVTVTGRYAGIARVPFGQSRTGPLPLLKGERLELWEMPPAASRKTPEIHFGIGVGTGGSNVGVGIGL
ncbi:MAG: hypothetical protein D6720_08585 [Gammaproteobacteria bacterium]|nr:MAG: hypothetical protein D6720_08585 [Gammaproteobacteria bacterium]